MTGNHNEDSIATTELQSPRSAVISDSSLLQTPTHIKVAEDMASRDEDNDKHEKQKVPIEIRAIWREGRVCCPALGLDSHLSEGQQNDDGMSGNSPTPSCIASHAPLILVAASFCQSFYSKAAEQGIEISNLQATASCEANLTAFYRNFHDVDAKDPWKTIDLDVAIDSDNAAPEELQILANEVMDQETSPTKELLQEHFSVEVKLQMTDDGSKNKTAAAAAAQPIEAYCDVSSYRKTSEGEDAVVQDQAVTCYCERQSDGNVIFQVDVNNETFPLSSTETVPVGATQDGHPTPVQAFFFGCLSFYMYTFAMRLAMRGSFRLDSFEGTYKTVMENGVKDYDDGLPPRIFSIWGGEIELNVQTDAPQFRVEHAFRETLDMSPPYLATTRAIDVDMDVEITY